MNYRHAFHAGNFADVHKHLVMLAIIERLKRKATPLFFLDTHAGRGRYDLQSPDATRGGEWRNGIGKLASTAVHSDDLRRYVEIAGLDQKPLRQYPGSPLLALGALRDDDRVVFVEQQSAEAAFLERELPRRRNQSIVCGDGYASLRTYLPPKENRGLVLMDPPYEAENEFVQAERALHFGLTRWPTGIFALWYPIKASRESQRLHAAVAKSGLRKLLRVELTIRPSDSPLGLNGSGMLIANPPWQFDTEMRGTLSELLPALASDNAARARVEWLVPE